MDQGSGSLQRNFDVQSLRRLGAPRVRLDLDPIVHESTDTPICIDYISYMPGFLYLSSAQRPESDLWTKLRPSCLDLIPIYSIITFNPLQTPLVSPFKSLYHNLLAQDVEVACRLPTVY
jgi:hypothetical protein